MLTHGLLQVLNKRIKKSIIPDISSVQINIEDASEEDRVAYAMFVSLYAVWRFRIYTGQF